MEKVITESSFIEHGVPDRETVPDMVYYVDTREGEVELMLEAKGAPTRPIHIKRLGPHEVVIEGEGETTVEYLEWTDLFGSGDQPHEVLTESGECVTLRYCETFDMWAIL